MRNRQVGPDHATRVLEDVVARVTYKPGWTIQLQEIDRGQGSQGLTLLIGATVPNSHDPSQSVDILHLMPVIPAAYDEETWTRWIFDQIALVEHHEAMEFYKVDGDPPFFSEHGPGRNPYTIAMVKTREQAYAAATPWNGGPATDEHFTETAHG